MIVGIVVDFGLHVLAGDRMYLAAFHRGSHKVTGYVFHVRAAQVVGFSCLNDAGTGVVIVDRVVVSRHARSVQAGGYRSRQQTLAASRMAGAVS